MQNAAAETFYQDFNTTILLAEEGDDEVNTTPALPSILLNAALSIVVVVGAFCFARFGLSGTLLTSTVIAGLIWLISFTPLGILAARLTGTPVLVGNLGWGCGVMVVMLLCFGLCGLSGAVAALLVRTAGLAAR